MPASMLTTNFAGYKDLSELTDWNLYSLQWAPVSLDGKWLVLQDKDLFDYARVERKIPATKELKVSFELMAEQNDKGLLQIEFLDENRHCLFPSGTDSRWTFPCQRRCAVW